MATGLEFIATTGGVDSKLQEFLSRPDYHVVVRMRGLPFDTTAERVIEFFESGKKPCQIQYGKGGIFFVMKRDGKATGDAFILFETEELAARALTRHKDTLGSRYVEIFRSSIAEAQQVVAQVSAPPKNSAPLIANAPILGNQTASSHSAISISAAHQPLQAASTNMQCCIHLKGLPYEAKLEHLLQFLGEHAKNVVFQGVHMLVSPHGQPSGEAMIELCSEQAAAAAAKMGHYRYMNFQNKKRFIEVVQCSRQEKNIMLLAGPHTAGGMLNQPSHFGAAQAKIPMHMFAPPISQPAPATIPPSAPFSGHNHHSVFAPPQQAMPHYQSLGSMALYSQQSSATVMMLPPGPGSHGQYVPLTYFPIPAAGGSGGMPYQTPGSQYQAFWPQYAPGVPSLAQTYGQQQAPVGVAGGNGTFMYPNANTIVKIRGLPKHAGPVEIIQFLQMFSGLTIDCVQLLAHPNGQPNGEALVTFLTRQEAERAVRERNGQILCGTPVELFMA